jgi:hypothetical protein
MGPPVGPKIKLIYCGLPPFRDCKIEINQRAAGGVGAVRPSAASDKNGIPVMLRGKDRQGRRAC